MYNFCPNIQIRFLVVFSILLNALLYGASADRVNEGKEVLKKVEGIRSEKNLAVKVNLSIENHNKNNRVQKVAYEVYYKGHNKTLVKQILPEEARGNFILMLGKDMWFYKKGNRRPIRITPQQRLLGGASNADIAKFGFYHDYDATLTGKDSIDGTTYLKLELKAKHSYLAYQKIYLYIHPKNFRIYKADFYGISNGILKTAYYSDYKNFGTLSAIPTTIKIIDRLFNTDNFTIIHYLKVQKSRIPEKYFNFNYLVHLK